MDGKKPRARGVGGVIGLETRFWKYVEKPADPNSCWMWIGKRAGQYGLIRRGRGEEGWAKAHRLSWEMTHGTIPPGLLVCHRCDVPLCVNPSHLFLGTNKDNQADKARKKRGSSFPGEKHPMAKLTNENVAAILGAPTISSKEWALRLGVTPSTIARVKRHATWGRS
jgi:hypothetical protein